MIPFVGAGASKSSITKVNTFNAISHWFREIKGDNDNRVRICYFGDGHNMWVTDWRAKMRFPAISVRFFSLEKSVDYRIQSTVFLFVRLSKILRS